MTVTYYLPVPHYLPVPQTLSIADRLPQKNWTDRIRSASPNSPLALAEDGVLAYDTAPGDRAHINPASKLSV